MKKDTRNNVRGFTLIEVLVTMMITSIGLMGLISLQMQALKGTGDAGNRSHANLLFNDIANRIQANQKFSDSYVTPVGGILCSNTVTPACNDQHEKTAAKCSGEQLAAWDLFEVACGTGNNDIISHPVQYLPGAILQISVANSKNLQVELTWNARSDDASITGADRTANSNELEISRHVPR